MASIRKVNSKWEARVRVKGYSTYCKSFTQKSDALAWSKSVEVGLETGITPLTRMNKTLSLEDDNCRTCGSENRLSNRKIFWFNVHEKYNTGLPNYWLLKIDADPWYGKWGRPYTGKMLCLKCKNPATISVFGPNQNYIKYNCEACDKVFPERRA